MQTFLALIRIDLLRWLRSPAEVLSVLGMPIAIVTVIGFVFGTPSGGMKTPDITVCVIDRDKGLFGTLLQSAGSRASDMGNLHFIYQDMEQSLELMEAGKASAIVILPETLTSSLFTQTPCTIEVVTNPRQSIMPQLVVKALEIAAEILSAGGLILAEPLQAIDSFKQTNREPTATEISGISVQFYNSVKAFENITFPPLLWSDEMHQEDDSPAPADSPDEAEPSDNRKPSPFDSLFPSIGLFALFFGSTAAVQDILRRMRDGRVQRSAVAPISHTALLCAYLIGSTVITFLAQAVMVLLGIVVFQVHWGNLIGVGSIVLAGALGVTGLQVVIVGICNSERQFSNIANLTNMAMCMLGGSMMPSEVFPKSLQALSQWTFNYWMIDGFKILQSGASIVKIAHPLAILLISGGIIFLTGAWLLGKKLIRGEVFEA